MIIDKSKYEGYVWESDKQRPEILPSSGEINTDVISNPFVIEAQLIDLGKNESLSIKFVDCEYLVSRYNLTDYKDIDTTEEEYIPNQMPGVDKLLFKRAWRLEKDEMCQGWDVLQPAELVFVGLKKQQKL